MLTRPKGMAFFRTEALTSCQESPVMSMFSYRSKIRLEWSEKFSYWHGFEELFMCLIDRSEVSIRFVCTNKMICDRSKVRVHD